jgi:hypothetical protein
MQVLSSLQQPEGQPSGVQVQVPATHESPTGQAGSHVELEPELHPASAAIITVKNAATAIARMGEPPARILRKRFRLVHSANFDFST